MVDKCAGSGDERNLSKNQELLDVQLCSLRVQGRGSVLVCGDRGDAVSIAEREESESCFSSSKMVVVFHPEYSITRTILFRSWLSVASVMLSSERRRESLSCASSSNLGMAAPLAPMAPVGIPLPAHLCSNHSPSARLGIYSAMATPPLGHGCSFPER
jgi:hypothetical protein